LTISDIEKRYDEAIELCHRLLLEPRLGDANLAALHLILAHVNDHASEHAKIALELYRTVFDGIETTEEEDNARKMAMELAEELLEEALKFEEEEARMLEEGDEMSDEEGDAVIEEGDGASQEGFDVMNKKEV
jgi:hypothetical protein